MLQLEFNVNFYVSVDDFMKDNIDSRFWWICQNLGSNCTNDIQKYTVMVYLTSNVRFYVSVDDSYQE